MAFVEYATSGFWVFLGCSLLILVTGIALNAAFLGLRGQKCDPLFSCDED